MLLCGPAILVWCYCKNMRNIINSRYKKDHVFYGSEQMFLERKSIVAIDFNSIFRYFFNVVAELNNFERFIIVRLVYT